MMDAQSKGISSIRARILVAAEPPLLRRGLVGLLSQEPDLQICCEVDDSGDVLGKGESCQPELAIIGLSLAVGRHVGLIEQLKAKFPKLKILAATPGKDTTFASRLLQAGARGCIHWDEPLEHVIQAVRNVLRGEIHVTSQVVARMLQDVADGKPADDDPVRHLSPRELDVFTMIGRGHPTQKIARELNLSPRTIETHRKNLKMKLGLQNAAQLSRAAYQWVRDNS